MLINKLQNIKMMILWLDNSSDKCMDVWIDSYIHICIYISYLERISIYRHIHILTERKKDLNAGEFDLKHIIKLINISKSQWTPLYVFYIKWNLNNPQNLNLITLRA